MYSGTVLRNKSGRVMGVHQRIDRLARRELSALSKDSSHFPTIRDILHFEGLNGPDGIKRKSPGQDEPWHYLDPSNPNDKKLHGMILDHMHNLTEALREENDSRASFEAAWLAHAITDGLTPAHHYPLEEKLEELRNGEGLETRNTPRKKLVMPGKTRRHQLANNWEFWGAKGVMTTHFMFEWGIATTLAAGKLSYTPLNNSDLDQLNNVGFIALFDLAVNRVAKLQLYEEFQKVGWTRRLARDTKEQLLPEIVRTVALAWYACLSSARNGGKK